MAEAEAPYAPSELAFVLLYSGWSWGHELLQQCVQWLQDQGINEQHDLNELAMDDLRNTDQWPNQAV
jgi:hypothetical protein